MARDSEQYPAGTITVKGATFEIFTNDAGGWLAYVSGDKVEADTRDGLKAKIARRLAASKITVAVPFLATKSNGSPRKGTATGLHSSTRNVLVRWEDGEADQVSRWMGGQTYLSDDADQAEWERLIRERNEAGRALYAFEQAHKIDLPKMVSAAVDAAVSESGEQSDS